MNFGVPYLKKLMLSKSSSFTSFFHTANVYL
uniref:Uncharacterized protein n=1 Tax=Heterorhabditis bacteriophora TaxID=37862 RepID=A0A1I7WL62_HETBA